jgi:hypothetical protein
MFKTPNLADAVDVPPSVRSRTDAKFGNNTPLAVFQFELPPGVPEHDPHAGVVPPPPRRQLLAEPPVTCETKPVDEV